jgi:spermidine synthase
VKKKVKDIISYIIPQVIEKRKSAISSHLEVRLEDGRYVLNTKNVNYSFGGLHKVFVNFFKKIKIENSNINKVLILGFGAGSVADLLMNTYKKECKIVGVEKDPVVIELAHKYFDLKKYKELVLHNEDAYNFVQRCIETFDLIVVDVFVGSRIPPWFDTPVFLQSLKRLLNPGGMLLFNRPFFDAQSRKDTLALINSISKDFKKTSIFKKSFYGVRNAVIVAYK